MAWNSRRLSKFIPGVRGMSCSNSAADVLTIVDPKDAAKSAGLRYVSDARPGISRRKSGKGFTYIRADGSKLSEAAVLRRIKALAIPPPWADVWICPTPDGHIQAMPRAASSTVTIPASVKSEKVPSTSMSSSLQMLSRAFGKRYASIWHCAVCQGRKSWQPATSAEQVVPGDSSPAPCSCVSTRASGTPSLLLQTAIWHETTYASLSTIAHAIKKDRLAASSRNPLLIA